MSNCVPFDVPGLSASSSSITLLQHLHHRILYLMSTDTPKIQYKKEVEVRVESCDAEVEGVEFRCMKPQKPKTKIKNGEREEVQRDFSHELLDWLQEFRENFVDESTSTEPWGIPEQGSQDTSKSSHELPMEPRTKVEPGSGSTVYISTFRRTQIVTSAWRWK